MMDRQNGNWWRDYQRSLQSERRRRLLMRGVPLTVLCAAGVFALVASLVSIGSLVSQWTSQPADVSRVEQEDGTPKPEANLVIRSQEDLRPILAGFDPQLYAGKNGYAVLCGGKSLTVKTSLDDKLQSYVEGLLARSKVLKGAAVVMDPFTGRILAMGGYGENGEDDAICLKADFPSASLIKIVSATAAIEQAGLTPDSTLYYNGGKYTLYKSQINERKGRYSVEVPLREAFAFSINPVFGKLGVFTIGRETLADYAERFLFNRAIPFDLKLGESSIEVPADDFGLAEIASGFNKRTLISPLHGVLLASTVANGGVMMHPWIVREVLDASGRSVYRAEPGELARPMQAATAREMRVLMEETVASGTCRRTVRRLTRQKRFQGMEIGAKTGTINDPTDQYKVDWLTAYVIEPKEKRGVCVAVMGMHGEKLGIRAPDLGRLILEQCTF